MGAGVTPTTAWVQHGLALPSPVLVALLLPSRPGKLRGDLKSLERGARNSVWVIFPLAPLQQKSLEDFKKELGVCKLPGSCWGSF